jgi:uncharacterized protein
MSLSPTYPGIYIQELQSTSHPITAAPTSVTVFVGYTHPFRTIAAWNTATQIFNFTDYQRLFGGLYTSGVIESHVAYAVYQFFLNGGSNAYVVPLQPNYYDSHGNFQGQVLPATVTVGPLVFTAQQPIDAVPMTVTINNIQTNFQSNDTADIQISYGPQAETYRKVNLNPNDPNFVGTRIAQVNSSGVVTGQSQLVTVAIPSNTQSGIVPIGQAALQDSPAVNPDWTTFSGNDFTQVFQQDSSLDKVLVFNLLLIPGVADNGISSEALAFAERKLAFVIMDPPPQDSADGYGSAKLPLIGNDIQLSIIPKSTNGALYFPYLQSQDPLTSNTYPYPPSGYVAGIYANTDNNRGVWKAPAGLQTTITSSGGVVPTGKMTDLRQGTLNPLGVNCLRDFPDIPTVVWGARTLVTDNPALVQWRYVPVRRMALFLEQTLYQNLTWVVFEPNDDPLWVAIRTSIESFMLTLFSQGAFQGSTPSQAFQVLCDSSTTTQTDIDNGIVNIIVAFAPLKPAEFVIVKIAQMAGQTQS